MSGGLQQGIDSVKLLSLGSPIAAGWGAALVMDKQLWLGILLAGYVVIWTFANASSMLIILRDNVRDLGPKK